jgi:hypothetical protein
MRIHVMFGSFLVATAMSALAAHAGSDGCCSGAPPFPKVVYALPPAPFVIPPTGYALDPSDAVRPFYVVNQGPYAPGFGAATYARPTYSEGGYAFADAYPYDYPYVVSHGFGMRYGYRAFRSDPRPFHGEPFVRPFGAPPYTAYRYRTAPSARIIHLPEDR